MAVIYIYFNILVIFTIYSVIYVLGSHLRKNIIETFENENKKKGREKNTITGGIKTKSSTFWVNNTPAAAEE